VENTFRLNTFRIEGIPFEWYNDPVYGVSIAVAYDCSPTDISNFFDNYAKNKDLDNNYEEWMTPEKVFAFTVRLFNLEKDFYMKHNLFHKAIFFYFDKRSGSLTPQTISTICHESLHGTISVFQNAGIELSDESEEAFTYYTGFISEVITVSLSKLSN